MLTHLRKLRRLLHLEDVDFLGPVAKAILVITGLSERARQNSLDVRLTEISLYFPRLPAAFDGYRILHVSDLHLNGMPELAPILARLLQGIEADVAVFTGDFHLRFRKDVAETSDLTRKILRHLNAPDGLFAVRGNHDVPELLPRLAGMGLEFLHNRAVPIRRGEAEIWLAGVDDPYHYEAADLQRALADIPTGGFVVLLAHTPELFREAAKAGVDLYLCGHTHGGQVSLPRVGPLFLNARAPRRVGSGLWREGQTLGYTSRGVGSTSVPLRFGCPPEVTLLHLRRSSGQ
ncbi:MAG: metallophosphoesterase [candidate division KSB1 bacterium]|nr:metallophosphoesterase [candidate division KSB1 bacterium]